ncbi:hypothetical protein [Xenophilus sp. Marseille-Q4582]|uniref:hypothetical protein n=1 Tax=Xenophilus sp. Marseille-Q4582 TaxID=2866600 RepID=UPI001CE47787|nr:hypothetical protein [Xenophilus sp. Marseille-Q4582]
MWLRKHWKPGCWSIALRKVCDVRLLETEAEIERYPEQWAFVLWRPMEAPQPFVRPDCWGFTIGSPDDEVKRLIAGQGGGEMYGVPDENCIWSMWIDAALACDTYEPWFTQVLQDFRDRERVLERQRLLGWYGHDAARFHHFLDQVIRPLDESS